MTRRRRLLANAGLFQLGWFACVLGAQRPWVLAIALACLVAHMLWIAEDRHEWRALLMVAACGWLLDSALLNLGLFDFPGHTWLLPPWLALLWLLFASTLRHSLYWTARPWWLASLLGGVAGPLSYFAGARLAGVGLPLGVGPSLLVLGLIWAALLPALHHLIGRLQR